MKLFAFYLLNLLFFFALTCCKSDMSAGYQVTMAVPVEYIEGFAGRAFLMETEKMQVNFRTALSVEAVDGRYSCSLNVFLASVKVWNSGHRSKFYTTDLCVLELTKKGDLHLKGPNERVGWRTGTSGQGVEKLQLLESGNLVLVDAMARIKWQTFNFPTDVLLQGQRLSVATQLTTIPKNTTYFYSFEIQHDNIALYLNSGKNKYSYWEFQPSKGRNITFIKLTSRGFELFDGKFRKFAQILSQQLEPVRFLALENDTGNLGLYHYSAYNNKFEASFQALNTACDLPLKCAPYDICTLTNGCLCIRLLVEDENMGFDCPGGAREGLCGGRQAEMLELEDAGSVLRSSSTKVNVSKEACASICLNDCNCVAALYSLKKGDTNMQVCSFYDLVNGVKQMNRGSGLSYLVKVPKREGGVHRKTSLRKWVMILVVVADGVVLFLVLAGLGYYMIWKRRKRLSNS
ncbi:hypothetical protein Nepgr_011844 [Nepenthes gracilis]|uniref:Bulb-type lectin domain-containing protein n=1 Tax=Nepenthes gracilis TaxID=150966 RepID=A0AAD3XM99_NEPGR|nr:hypothetical protein Nepgr_011844 [Nepenthes gracilis]